MTPPKILTPDKAEAPELSAGSPCHEPKEQNVNPLSVAPQNDSSHDLLTILQAQPGRVLTKRFKADGAKIDFTAGFLLRVEETPARTWAELLDALTLLVDCPDMCIVRGAAKDDCPRSGEAGEWVYRRLHDKPGEPANFVSVPRHWVVYDFDETSAPFDPSNPEASIRSWHTTLAPELRAACSAFFPSASAHVSPYVRGKLVVWYKVPISERQARALAVHYRADPSVAIPVQPNYFAAPIFEGCRDPLEGKRAPIVFDGRPATQPSPAALKATRMRPPPAAVRLGKVPPGDRGILAALGDAAELVGLRFAIAGKLGGIMRKLGFRREDCAAVVQEWIPPEDLAPRLTWALGAWDRDPADVSGFDGLAELVGKPHAEAILKAVSAARRPTRLKIRGAK
jgi:hypothetical protein